MANYVWPPALPQVPQRGFSESVGANIIRTPTDQGPAKQRRRSLRPSTMGVSFLMTTAQVAILQDFLYDTLQGVKAFDFTHPRTGYAVNTRVVPGQDGELFKSTYAAPDYWTITLNFEILPTFTTLSPGSYNIPIGRLSQFSRASTATYIEDGVLRTAAINEPRWQDGKLLVEGAATNQCWPSRIPTTTQSTTYGRVNINGATQIVAGAVGIDGTANAFTVSGANSWVNSAGENNIRISYSLPSGGVLAFSAWVRTSGATPAQVGIRFNILEGGSGQTQFTTAQWIRISRTVTVSASGTVILASTGGTPWEMDGLQVEYGPLSSYIPTTTAAATRAADLAIISAT